MAKTEYCIEDRRSSVEKKIVPAVERIEMFVDDELYWFRREFHLTMKKKRKHYSRQVNRFCGHELITHIVLEKLVQIIARVKIKTNRHQ